MRGSFIGFRGCEGPQPSKVRNSDRSSDRDLEGVRSLGAVLVDASFVLPQQAIRTMRGSLLGFASARDRSPPKSRTAIEVLIQTWRAPVPRRRIGRCQLRFAATSHAYNAGLFIGFRGCEGPQPSKVKNGDRSSDPDLEGVRVPRRRTGRCQLRFAATSHAYNAGLFIGFRGCEGPQPS